jgi:hypothetical protein
VHENQIIERMVLSLRSRPGEWLTFSYLSTLVALPGCDADLIGAMADFRPDIFAVAKDRKLKLREQIVADIAKQEPRAWRVPDAPTRAPETHSIGHGGSTTGMSEGASYCHLPDEEILADLKEGSIPDEALVYSCCWKNICRVRGLYFNLVPPDVWIEICRRRGYIQQRENPRGF